MSAHPSRLKIDELLYNELAPAEARTIGSHLESCTLCRQEVGDAERLDSWFREHYPTLDDLSAAVGGSITNAGGPTASPAGRQRQSRWWWGIGGGLAAAAAATILVMALPSGTSEPSTAGGPAIGDGSFRSKGSVDSALALTVERGGAAAVDWNRRPLHPGDLIRLTYTSQRRHLLLVSREVRSGKLSLLLQQPIEPGANVAMNQGIALDDYIGGELWLAIFTDEAVREADWMNFRAMNQSEAERRILDSYPGSDIVTLSLVKDKP